MKTVLQLKTEVRNAIFASGEPENLVSAHDEQFQEVFAELSKYVDGERSYNADAVRFFKTFYKAGMTVMEAPKGVVRRVFTVANENYDDPVFYRQVEWPQPEAWARNLFLFPQPLVAALPTLPRGFQHPTEDNDSLYGRARTGIWALWQGRIYLAPWIQSNELVVLEWDGIKTRWQDLDLINEEILYKKAVKLYVQHAHERDYGDAGRARQFHDPVGRTGWYDEALGDLIHEARERSRVQPFLEGGWERNRLCAELADDAPPTTPAGVTIADLGNISLPGNDLDEVALLARSWNPDAIVACGMIAGTVTNYDLTAGAKFYDYMMPYLGSAGIGGQSKAFYAVPGAADWAKDALASFQEFFTPTNNGRYYDVVIGDVHLFVIDSSALDGDGNTQDSVQAQWLQARLATSTAAWKVVKFESSAYGSIHVDGNLQWPFKNWGAHMVITSQTRNYERLSVDGLPVINNGLGGQSPIEVAGDVTALSVFLYAGSYGAGKIRANESYLQYEFYDVAGELVDRVLLAAGTPPTSLQGVLIDPQGNIVTDPQGQPVFEP